MTMNGKRILVTRSAAQARTFSEALSAHGAVPVVVPTIEIVPPQSYREIDRAVTDLAGFDYLILTSVNAVKAFCDRLKALNIAAARMNHLQTVAVGPKSAEALTAYGFQADLIPEDYRAEGVVALLRDRVAGKRVLYPKAELARDLIPVELEKAGADVVAPVAYGSAPPADAPAQLKDDLKNGLDLLTFTASSTVTNFVTLLDAPELEQARTIPVASIGPLTTETATHHGFTVVVEPEDSTLDDMIKAIDLYFSQL